MLRGYLLLGLMLTSLLAYANTVGWSVTDSVVSGRWGPRGPAAYHK